MKVCGIYGPRFYLNMCVIYIYIVCCAEGKGSIDCRFTARRRSFSCGSPQKRILVVQLFVVGFCLILCVFFFTSNFSCVIGLFVIIVMRSQPLKEKD